jgi:hypothetical protein
MSARYAVILVCLIQPLVEISVWGDEVGTLTGGAAGADTVVKEGMRTDQVIALLKPPKKVARQILLGKHLEQWTYDEPIALRIEIRGFRGQEAHVVSVHSLRSKKPK